MEDEHSAVGHALEMCVSALGRGGGSYVYPSRTQHVRYVYTKKAINSNNLARVVAGLLPARVPQSPHILTQLPNVDSGP